MFQPQNVTCAKCGKSHQIITEDIPSRDICVGRLPFTHNMCLWVHLCCPECHCMFDLRFAEKSVTNNGTLFECEKGVNTGLQMCKKIERGSISIPTYHPNIGARTAFEHILDNKALTEVNRIYPWQNQTDPAKTLAGYLGEIDDYTQSIKWKKFKGGQLIVAFCAYDGHPNHFRGFNGIFRTVNKKNTVLTDDFETKLGEIEENCAKHYCYNKIGHCAEMHAANSCLNGEPTPTTDDLRFSIAYQCRTATPRSYCLNCITLFRNVNNG